VYVEKPEEAAWKIIVGYQDTINQNIAGEIKVLRLCFAITSPDGVIEGGILRECLGIGCTLTYYRSQRNIAVAATVINC
jgi:hypothetical protein